MIRRIALTVLVVVVVVIIAAMLASLLIITSGWASYLIGMSAALIGAYAAMVIDEWIERRGS